MSDMGGEPWWVVVAECGDREYVSSAVDAPTPEDAEAEAQRLMAANRAEIPTEFGEVKSIARITGPFPRHVPTADRERRPHVCGGCGLGLYCGNHAPTPRQTWFSAPDIESEYDETPWECVNCGTLTWLPDDWQGVPQDA